MERESASLRDGEGPELAPSLVVPVWLSEWMPRPERPFL